MFLCAALGPGSCVSVAGMLGILEMSRGCLDTTSSPWHSCKNVLPSSHFARKDTKGQREHREGDIGVYGPNVGLRK